MEFRSVADLDATVREWATRLPDDIEVIVGIPRSGLLVASLLGLHLNLPIATVDGLLAGRVEQHGSTRRLGLEHSHDEAILGRPRKVVVVDDAIRSGDSLRRDRRRLDEADLPHTILYGVVYGVPGNRHPEADFVAERLATPHVFAWHLLHHPTQLRHMAVALEGVLLPLPRPMASRLDDHLRATRPLWRPTELMGTVVSDVGRDHEAAVTAWLDRHGLRYGQLVVRDPGEGPPLAASYARGDSALLLVGREDHAEDVARATRRPVLAMDTMTMHEGSAVLAAIGGRGRVTQVLRQVLPGRAMDRLRQLRRWWRRRRSTRF